MRIAAVQFHATGDWQQNLQEISGLAAQAAASGARLVVFPEASFQAFETGDLHAHAQDVDGPFARTIKELAAELGIVIMVGIFRPGDQVFRQGKTSDRVLNTALIVGDDLEETYDKIHTYDALGNRESDTVRPGEHLVSVEVDGLQVGLAICFDLRFPELFRELACRGAHAIVVPTSWAAGPGKVRDLLLLARARALDTGCFIVLADQALAPGGDAGETSGPTGVGHSVVVAPDGTVRAEAGEGPEVLIAEIDVAEVTAQRRALPVLPR